MILWDSLVEQMLEQQRGLIVASLLYAAAITFNCPCVPLLDCHLPHFYLATLGPVALVMYLNSNKNNPNVE